MKKLIIILLFGMLTEVIHSQVTFNLDNDTTTGFAKRLSSYYNVANKASLYAIATNYVIIGPLYSDSSFTIGFDSAMADTTKRPFIWPAGIVFFRQYKLGTITDIWFKSTNGGLIYLNGSITVF